MATKVGDLIWIARPAGRIERDFVASYGRLWRVTRAPAHNHPDKLVDAAPFYLTDVELLRAADDLPYPWGVEEYEPYTGQLEEQADGG